MDTPFLNLKTQGAVLSHPVSAGAEPPAVMSIGTSGITSSAERNPAPAQLTRSQEQHVHAPRSAQ